MHVYRVKYGEARQLARVLNDIFSGGGTGSVETAASQIAPGGGLTKVSSNADRLPGLSAATGTQSSMASTSGRGLGAGIGGVASTLGGGSTAAVGGTPASAYSGTPASTFDARGTATGGGQPALEGVKISADVSSNSLLVYASAENYRVVEQTIRQLDQPQAQVGIEATIAEVTLNNELSYGVQFYITSKDIGLRPDKGSALNVPTSPPGALPTIVNGVATQFLNRAFPGFNFLIGPQNQPNMVVNQMILEKGANGTKIETANDAFYPPFLDQWPIPVPGIPPLLTTRDALRFATMNGAKALRLDQKVGSLTPGKEADIIILDATRINAAPLNHVPGAVVSLMDRTNVETVIVAGKVRKWKGQLLDVDLDKLRSQLEASRDAIFAAAGIPQDLFDSH